MKTDSTLSKRSSCRSCSLGFAYKEITLLYEIALELTNNTEVYKAIEYSMRRLKQYDYLERCALFKTKDDVEELELISSIDLKSHQKKRVIYRFGEGATGLAAKSHEPIVIENIHNSFNYLNKMGNISTQMVSYVAVPLLQGEEVIGVISANIGKDSLLDFDDIVRMLTIVGSLFIGSLKVFQKLTKEKESLTDLKCYYQEETQQEYRFEKYI